MNDYLGIITEKAIEIDLIHKRGLFSKIPAPPKDLERLIGNMMILITKVQIYFRISSQLWIYAIL